MCDASAEMGRLTPAPRVDKLKVPDNLLLLRLLLLEATWKSSERESQGRAPHRFDRSVPFRVPGRDAADWRPLSVTSLLPE